MTLKEMFEQSKQLDNFIELANAFHSSIEFTVDISASNTVFLDTTSKIVDANVVSSVHQVH